MEEFKSLVSRHGEHGIQAILENWERFCGVSYPLPMPLEKRWETFVTATACPVRAAA